MAVERVSIKPVETMHDRETGIPLIRCTACKMFKIQGEFFRNSGTSTGRSTYCKLCFKLRYPNRNIKH